MSLSATFPRTFVIGSEYPHLALEVAKIMTAVLAALGIDSRVCTFSQIGLAEVKQDTTGTTTSERAQNTAWLYFQRYGPVLAQEQFLSSTSWCIVCLDQMLVVPSLAGLEGHAQLPGIDRSRDFFHGEVHPTRERFIRLMGGREDRGATVHVSVAFLSRMFNHAQGGQAACRIARSYDRSVQGYAWEPLLLFQRDDLRVARNMKRWRRENHLYHALSQGVSMMRNRPARMMHIRGDDRVPQGMHLYIWDDLEGPVPLVRCDERNGPEPKLAAS